MVFMEKFLSLPNAVLASVAVALKTWLRASSSPCRRFATSHEGRISGATVLSAWCGDQVSCYTTVGEVTPIIDVPVIGRFIDCLCN